MEAMLWHNLFNVCSARWPILLYVSALQVLIMMMMLFSDKLCDAFGSIVQVCHWQLVFLLNNGLLVLMDV